MKGDYKMSKMISHFYTRQPFQTPSLALILGCLKIWMTMPHCFHFLIIFLSVEQKWPNQTGISSQQMHKLWKFCKNHARDMHRKG